MHSRITLALAALLASTISAAAEDTSAAAYARDRAQAVDAAYTAKIREYTTDPQFNTPLTDYLPATSPARRTICRIRPTSTAISASSPRRARA